MHRKGFYEKFIKRPQDFLLALIATVILSPVLLVTAVLVRTKLGSPVLFRQERPGRNAKVFRLYKFRTMTDAKDKDGNLLPDEVRPGFTGLAQVNGRNAISWEQKFDYDVQYVDNITFTGDWKIIFRTVSVVIHHDGIQSATSATMEEFMGSPEKED